ncbi:MAG: hypothetical protein ACAI25_13880 [Planctomycetota bacterium]
MKNIAKGVLGAVFLLSGVALAATVLKLDNEQLAQRADVIVHGRCVKATPRPGPNPRLSVVTDYELEVTEFLKGGGDSAAKVFSFTALGGKLADGSGFTISGSPTYAVDDELILFLDAVHPQTGCRTAIGLGQGKFLVQAEPNTSKKHLVRDLGGLRLVDKDGRVVGIQAADGPKVYLEPFSKEIKSYVAAQSGGKK